MGIPENKKVVIVGGGTVYHVRPHFALSAPAYGTTARKLVSLIREHEQSDKFDVILRLTKMADPNGSTIETNEDLAAMAQEIVADNSLKILFWNPAVCDWEADATQYTAPPDCYPGPAEEQGAGKYGTRLLTRGALMRGEGGCGKWPPIEFQSFVELEMYRAPKIVSTLRKARKDFTLVAFKTTSGATEDEMYKAGLALMKEASANLVLANDVKTRLNMIITPEEARYHVTTDRDEALRNLVDMAILRSHLTFTRSTVVQAERVPWESDGVPPLCEQ